MDIEKLTRETILKNMTPEQQKAVLESVMASVQESKKVRTQKVAENVDLVLQALKKIEAQMLARVNQAASLVETTAKNVKDGKDGRDGKDGKAGKDGVTGPKGADGRNGVNGKDGKDGRDGIDGVSVVNAFLDFDNSLVIELSNGKQINVGGVLQEDLSDKVKIIANGGGTSQYVLDALADLQAQINSFVGGLAYQGLWNASTNTPALVSSTGTNGYYYVVSVAGSTNLDGITDWQIGDWVIYNGTAWQKIDQTNLVTSVAGRTGAVTLTTSDIGGLGTIATQNSNAVAITGGSINGTTVGATTASTGAFTTVTASTSLTTPVVQATNSGGLSLKNSAGTTQMSMGAGGGDNISINVSTNLSGTNAQIDISPTGTGHVHIKPSGSNSVEINPTVAGTIDNMVIGGTTPKAGAFTSVTSSTAIGIASGGTGQTTANGAFNALAPSQATNSGKYLTTDGTNTSWASISAGASISNDTSTATNVYPLFAAATTGTPATIYTSNANYLYKPSTGTLSTLFHTTSGTITGSLNAGAFSYGTLSYSDVDITMSTSQSVNSYSQQIQQNTGAGTAASADYIVSNNNGTASTYYGDFGITSSGFNTPGQNITNNPNTVYLQSVTTDLAIGTLTSGKTVYFYSGGASTAAMSIAAGVTNIVTPVATNGIYVNSQTIAASYTIASGQSGMSSGPVTIASGQSVTVSSGSRWVVV